MEQAKEKRIVRRPLQVTFYGKGQKTRAVTLPVSLWKELEKVRTADDDPVFPSKKKSNGGALQANQVRRIVGIAGKRAGINGVSPHYFRHSHASHSLDRGASLQLGGKPGYVQIETRCKVL